jgi:PhzF family phenazine biosynthesis protein
MKLPLFQVDAFSKVPFKGNPAVVCLLKEPQPDGWMQALAAEMNLSETAFLLPEGDGYRLRWFTPAVEVSLCGHATLASAHILFTEGLLKPEQTASFFTHSGLLTAKFKAGWIEMNFPVRQVDRCEPPADVIEALGVVPSFVGKSRSSYLVEVENEEIVRSASPDFSKLSRSEAHGVMLTSRASSSGYDFISRFFAPRVGVNEDPVTGSAHCSLVPYWSKKMNKTSFLAYQASARGGELRLQLDGERVLIAGQAVTVFRAEMDI